MIKKPRLLAILALAAVNSYASDPIYVDLGIGLNTSWSTVAYNGNIGYLFNRYFGVEGGLTYSSSYTYNWSSASASGSYNTAYFMYDAAVKGILPLSDEFSLYGKLGAAVNNYSTWGGCNGCGGPTYSGSNTGLLYGAGAQFNLSPQWSLHLEDYTVTGTNPNMLMFGGEYKF